MTTNSEQVSTIIGEHCYLRPIEEADIGRGWLQWMNDEEITRSLSTSTGATHASLKEYLEKSQPPQCYMFGICLIEDDQYVGNARLSGVDNVNKQATYGWLIGNKNLQGRGIGTEALILLLRFAFESLGLNRVSTSIAASNTASIRANEKAGFTHEGILRERLISDGIFVDAVQISILRREFEMTRNTTK